MTGIQQMCFDFLEIAAVRARSFRWNDEVVLAPYDQGPWLMFPEERLELRIERNAGPLVAHEIHLKVAIAGAIQSDLIESPGGWVEQCLVCDAWRRCRSCQEM